MPAPPVVRPVEVEVLEALPDWEIHAALLSQPKVVRGCIEDAHDYANRFSDSQRNVEFFETDNFRVTGFSLKTAQSLKVGSELGRTRLPDRPGMRQDR